MTLEVRDSRVHRIIPKEAEFEQIVTGFKFSEGPIWHPTEKHLTFSDIIGDTIYRWSEADGLTTFRRPSHMANGNSYDKQGRMVTCEHASSRVTRTGFEGQAEVLASHFEGRELNSPNDIVVKSDGAIYFTDPPFGRVEPWGPAREQELDVAGVYRLEPADKSLTLLVDDFQGPNGLCFSVDESLLFVNDSYRNHIRAFEVQADGTLANGRIWAEMSGEGEGVADGMKVDQAGHLFCCGPGGIYVFDDAGTCLGLIRTPEGAANFTWGGDDMCSLYITASTSLYRLRVAVPGIPLL